MSNVFLKFDIKYSNHDIDYALMIVLQHFQSNSFLERVRNIGGFKHSNATGKEVARDISHFNGAVKIKSYKPFWLWSKKVAYAKNRTIFFNARKNHDDHLKICGTIAHELMKFMGYKHKSNCLKNQKHKTVPYMIGLMFKEHVEQLKGQYWKVN